MNDLDMCQLMLTGDELNIVRQWFNAVYDLNEDFLEKSDYVLAKKIHNQLDVAPSKSILDKAT